MKYLFCIALAIVTALMLECLFNALLQPIFGSSIAGLFDFIVGWLMFFVSYVFYRTLYKNRIKIMIYIFSKWFSKR